MFNKNKKQTFNMDIAAANTSLQNVFAACDKAPNQTPFDILVLRQKVNTNIANVGQIACIILLIFLIAFPFFLYSLNTNDILSHEDFSTLYVSEDSLDEEGLHIFLSGADVAYDECYAINSIGGIIYPTSYDEVMQEIIFPYDKEDMNIYIYDETGDYLHLMFTQYN